ncbi:dihydroorotate dehydrogenase [Schnuerera sp. xch1]|uniref:dihydroorotate dehydrogenase n=1 Tax=Schnuerera sp. xch1 TaxID=2874283 RepID=UPI001CBEB3DC|nr:dihydroorotate dehydrogenase [Schnuerera sp. xch1]MBZ2174005.1 dihydroorotate dehydrogenase [Schnuerera sp. xch1]
MTDLTVNICGTDLKNPVIAASGTFGFGREFSEYFSLSRLGGISSKGLTLNRREGNTGIRIYETTGGLLNSIGLQNPGIDEFIENELPFMEQQGTVIMANVGGNTIDEYIKAVDKLNETNIDIIELNISCPNVKKGGMAFGIKAETAYKVVSEVRQICKKPLIVKLSPNAEDIVHMAESCVKAGADGLSLVNTFSGMAIDIKSRKPIFDNIIAGLSGPGIKPIALRMVYQVSKAVDVPILGIGGIMDYKDVVEFIMVGAWAIQVGSGNFKNPKVTLDIIEGLKEFMIEEGIKSLEEIRGII